MAYRITGLPVPIFAILLTILTASPMAAAERVTFAGVQFWPDTKTVRITGILSKPKGAGPFPAVVILPNCGGPNRPEFKTFWPRYLHKLGYATLNVDHFTARGRKNCTKKYKPGAKELIQDAYGALAYLETVQGIDTGRVAVMGSSLGAHTVNKLMGLGKRTATGLNFSGAISLYPSQCKGLSPSRAAIRTLVIQGDKEKGVRSCERLAGRPGVTVSILSNTHHAFDQRDATPLKGGRLRSDIAGNKRLYSASATTKAQELVKAFLSEQPAVRPSGPKGSEADTGERLPKVGNKDPYVAVSRLDTDGDGKVSQSEWKREAFIFGKIDADGDGFITPREFYDRWISRQ